MQEKTLNKLFYKDAFLIFLNKFFSTIATVLVTYYYAHHLPTTAYGHYQNFWVHFYTFNAVAGLGISSFVFTYSTSVIKQLYTRTKKQYFFIAFAAMLLCAVGFAWLQTSYGNGFGLSLIFLLLSTVSVIVESLMIVFRNFRALLFINVLYFLAYLAIHFYPFYLGTYHFHWLLTALVILISVRLVLLLSVFVKSFRVTEVAQHQLEKSNYKNLWLHLYIFDMTQILMSMADKFLITLFVDKATSAVYQNGTFPIPFLPIIFSAVSSASLLQFSKIHNAPFKEIEVLKNLGKTLANFAFPVFFFFLFFSHEFIVFFFSEKYLASQPIFVVSLFVLPIRAFNFTVLLQKHERGRLITQGVMLDIAATLLLMYPLYQIFGLKGIALSFVLGTYLQASFYLYFIQKLLQQPLSKILPWQSWLVKFVFFGIIIFLLHHFTTMYFTNISAMLMTIFAVALTIFIFMRKETKAPTAVH